MLLSTLCARNVPAPQNDPRSGHGGLLLRLAVPLSTGGPAGSFEREGEGRRGLSQGADPGSAGQQQRS